MATILVIDDDPYIRELVGTLLKVEGFEIHEAVNGRDALQKLSGRKTDLCVLDLMMPDMDGFEFCRHARNYYDELPILMLTEKGDISQKVQGFEIVSHRFGSCHPVLVCIAKSLCRNALSVSIVSVCPLRSIV